MSQVTARSAEDKVGVTIDFDFGSNLDEAVSLFGPDAVYSGFLDAAVISLQSNIRRLSKKGADAKTIQSQLSEWKPTASGLRKPKKVMTMEEKRAMLDQLTKELQAAGAL